MAFSNFCCAIQYNDKELLAKIYQNVEIKTKKKIKLWGILKVEGILYKLQSKKIALDKGKITTK